MKVKTQFEMAHRAWNRPLEVLLLLFSFPKLSPILTDLWLQVMAILLLNPDQLFVAYQLHVLNRKLGHLMQWLN